LEALPLTSKNCSPPFQAIWAWPSGTLIGSREAAKRATHLAISGEIAKAVSSTLKPEDVFRTIVKEIRRVVPCERCLIVQPDPEIETFRYLHVESDIEISQLQMGHRSSRWFEKLYSQRKPYRVADYTGIDTPNARILAESGLHSAIFIPIHQNDKTIAHFGLLRKEIDSFSKDEEELLLSIAAHLGSAIRNATLYEESRDYTAQLRLLGELSHELSVQTDPTSIFKMIGRAGREVLKADRCAISEMNDEGTYTFSWSFGLSDRFIEAVTTRKKPRAAHTAVREARAIFIPDVLSDERTAPMHDIMREEGYRSVLHLPLRGKGLGFSTVSYHFDKIASLPDHLIETAQTFADQAAAAIEKAHLFEESQRRADRLEILNQVTQKITGNLSLDDVLASISDAAVKLFRADHARIYLLDAPSRDFVLQASSGISPPSSRLVFSPKIPWQAP
jgi:GAF domain-containing protein